MYCIKRIQYGGNKQNNYCHEPHVSLNDQYTGFKSNKNGIYVPNNDSLIESYERQDIIVPTVSYIKYPYKTFTNKIIFKLNSEPEQLKSEKAIKLQHTLMYQTNKMLEIAKNHAPLLNETPIITPSLIPKLENIKEISKIVSILYFNIEEINLVKNISFYAVAKSFHQGIMQSSHLKPYLMEINHSIYKKLLTNLDNIHYQLSVLNLKKALYPINPNMSFYFSNESGVFRYKEFLQAVECVNIDHLPGNYLTKHEKGVGDLWYKKSVASDLEYLELKTADIPQFKLYNLLSKIHVNYSNLENILICFDIKSSEQQDMITDYLLEHKITNVTSVWINNSKFFGDTSYYDTTYGVTNPVSKETIDFFSNQNFIQNYFKDLEKDSLNNNNKVNLLQAEEKLDQLVDPKTISLITKYQEIGNLEELIDHSKYEELDFNQINTNLDTTNF